MEGFGMARPGSEWGKNVWLNCQHCAESFLVIRARQYSARFCSKACRAHSMTKGQIRYTELGVFRTCIDCGQEKRIEEFPFYGKRHIKAQNKPRCKSCYSKHSYWTSKEKRQNFAASLRLEVIKAYGGKCTCCGETEPDFLCLDHVGGWGYIHRKAVNGSVYADVKRMGFPQDGRFRLLCWNCNCSTSLGRECPHSNFDVMSMVGGC